MSQSESLLFIPIPVTSYPIVARSVVLCDLQGAGLPGSLGRALGYFVIGIGIIEFLLNLLKLFPPDTDRLRGMNNDWFPTPSREFF